MVRSRDKPISELTKGEKQAIKIRLEAEAKSGSGGSRTKTEEKLIEGDKNLQDSISKAAEKQKEAVFKDREIEVKVEQTETERGIKKVKVYYDAKTGQKIAQETETQFRSYVGRQPTKSEVTGVGNRTYEPIAIQEKKIVKEIKEKKPAAGVMSVWKPEYTQQRKDYIKTNVEILPTYDFMLTREASTIDILESSSGNMKNWAKVEYFVKDFVPKATIKTAAVVGAAAVTSVAPWVGVPLFGLAVAGTTFELKNIQNQISQVKYGNQMLVSPRIKLSSDVASDIVSLAVGSQVMKVLPKTRVTEETTKTEFIKKLNTKEQQRVSQNYDKKIKYYKEKVAPSLKEQKIEAQTPKGKFTAFLKEKTAQFKSMAGVRQETQTIEVQKPQVMKDIEIVKLRTYEYPTLLRGFVVGAPNLKAGITTETGFTNSREITFQEYKTFGKEETKERINSAQIQRTKTLTFTKIEPELIKDKPRSFIRPPILDEDIGIKTASPSQVQTITTIQEPITKLKQKQKLKPLLKEDTATSSKTFTGLPKITLPSNKGFLNSTSPLFEGFDVFVKRKGKYVKENISPLSEEGAKALGFRKTEFGSPASFKIKPSKSIARSSDKLTPFEELIFSKQYYKKQERDDSIFVEKRKYRISTPQEVQEISYKGLMSQWTKKGKLL
jgi:hypothetical protein